MERNNINRDSSKNDILREAQNANIQEYEKIDDETLVFHRQDNTVENSPNASNNQVGNKGLTPIQAARLRAANEAKTRQQSAKSSPTAMTPKQTVSPKTSVPTPKKTISPKTASPTPKQTISPKTSVPTPKQTVSPKTVAPAPKQTVLPKPATLAPKQTVSPKSATSMPKPPVTSQLTQKQEIKTTNHNNALNPNNKIKLNSPNRENNVSSILNASNKNSNVYQSAKSNSNSIKSHSKMENNDFEIDYDTSDFLIGKNGKYSSDSAFVDSASSAVMSLVKAVIYIVAIVAVSIGLSVFAINTANDVFKFVTEDKMVTVNIPEYATIDDVADALYDAGAIKYKWAFNLWCNLKKEKGNFIPGTYEVSTTLNYDYLRASFKKSSSKVEVRITIPEGYTIDEMIALFISKGIGTKEGFVDAINNYDFDYPFLKDLKVLPDRYYRLEGYLFPDTYNFYQDSSEVVVLKKLLDNFNLKFVSEYYDRCKDLGLTVDEAITLASMIEKETRYADELGYVSSVFHNRLKYKSTYPYLNCDATIMYAMQHELGARPETMDGEDTEYKSPYNTYKNKGLPPGPIANPGLNSIKYALYPNDSDYFYFVSDGSGRMLFAKTEPEHLKNINKVRGQ